MRQLLKQLSKVFHCLLWLSFCLTLSISSQFLSSSFCFYLHVPVFLSSWHAYTHTHTHIYTHSELTAVLGWLCCWKPVGGLVSSHLHLEHTPSLSFVSSQCVTARLSLAHRLYSLCLCVCMHGHIQLCMCAWWALTAHWCVFFSPFVMPVMEAASVYKKRTVCIGLCDVGGMLVQ